MIVPAVMWYSSAKWVIVVVVVQTSCKGKRHGGKGKRQATTPYM